MQNPTTKRIRPLFLQWLDEKGYIQGRKSDEEKDAAAPRKQARDKFDHEGAPSVSFTGFDGWSAKVPAADMRTALYAYAESIKRGERLFVTEMMWKKRKLAFDFDFGAKLEWSYVKKCCNLLQFMLQFFFREDSRDTACIVLMSNGEHSNIHVLFPYLVVDQATSTAIYHAVATSFSAYMGPFQDKTSWSSVIDGSIYCTSLRMVGSWKIVNCPCSASDQFYACQLCSNGRIQVNRQYQLKAVLNPDGSENAGAYSELADDRNVFPRVIVCSMFCDQSENMSKVTLLSHAPKAMNHQQLFLLSTPPPFDREIKEDLVRNADAVSDEMKQLYDAGMLKYEEEKIKQALAPKSKSTSVKRVVISSSDPIFLATQQWMQQSLRDEYSKLEIAHMWTDEKRSYYQVEPVGIGNRFCQNLHPLRSHTNSSIYFVFSRFSKECYQRCHSRKHNIDRQYGKCLQFKSKGVPLSKEMQFMLFPYITPSPRKTKRISGMSSVDLAQAREFKNSDMFAPVRRPFVAWSPEMMGAAVPVMPSDNARKMMHMPAQEWLRQSEELEQRVMASTTIKRKANKSADDGPKLKRTKLK